MVRVFADLKRRVYSALIENAEAAARLIEEAQSSARHSRRNSEDQAPTPPSP